MTYRLFASIIFWLILPVKLSASGVDTNSDSLKIIQHFKKTNPDDSIVYVWPSYWGVDTSLKYHVFYLDRIHELAEYDVGFRMEILSIKDKNKVFPYTHHKVLGIEGMYSSSNGINDLFTIDIDSNGVTELVVVEKGISKCQVLLLDQNGDSSYASGSCEFHCYNVYQQSGDSGNNEFYMFEVYDNDPPDRQKINLTLVSERYNARLRKNKNIPLYSEK